MKAFFSLLKNAHRPKIQAARRTVGQRNPFAIPVGAAANYPATGTCASQRLTVQGQPQVDDRQNYAD
jgi:hypothetical protein